MEAVKAYPTIGVCGLDCGLCPRYYTAGPSRCPGCGGPGFAEKHPSCSFLTCCVKKKGLEVCGQCPEFPCPKFKSEEEYRQVACSSSYPPYAVVLSNLRSVRDKGLGEFVRRQEERIRLLEAMIEGYDDGRSKSYYCRAAAMLEPAVVKRVVAQVAKATERGGAGTGEAAGRAKVLRGLLADAACRRGIEMKGRR